MKIPKGTHTIPLREPIEQADDAEELLRYKQVKKLCGWKTNKSITDRVRAGDFKRVRIGPTQTHMRITKTSVDEYLARMNDLKETAAFFDKTAAQMAAMRQVKAREDVIGKLPVAEPADLSGALRVVPEEQIKRNDLGAFAHIAEDFNIEDPLTHRVIPFNCHLDEDENIVCGILESPYAELMFLRRKKRLGLNGSPKYMALQVSESRAKVEKLTHAESEAIYKSSYLSQN